jgi:type IV secretion system protein VirB4
MRAFFKDQAWLASLSSGVILHTDGRLQRTACLGGSDLEAAQPAELVGMWARIDDTLRALGPEWLVLVQTCHCVARVEKVARFAAPGAMLIAIASKVGSNGKDHQFETAYCLTFELWCAAMKVRSRDGRMLESRGREQSASASGYVSGFIERTDRVLQLIERIVPAARWLSEEAAVAYTRACMASEHRGVRCAFQIVLSVWIVFPACGLLHFSVGGPV